MDDTPHEPAPDLGDGTTDSRADLESAGLVSCSDPDAPEAEAFALDVADELEAYDAELIATEGPDALTSERAARLSEFTRRQAAERTSALRAAEDDPSRVGSFLAAFRRRRGLTRDQLADWLGITAEDVDRLALLPLPPTENELTVLLDPEPINDLADRYDAHRERLYEVFNQGDP
jgi:hypothetical protein